MTELRCGKCAGSNLKLKGLPMETDGYMIFYCSDCSSVINFAGGNLGDVLSMIRSSSREVRELKEELKEGFKTAKRELSSEIESIKDGLEQTQYDLRVIKSGIDRLY